MQPSQAQAEPETPHSLHHPAAALAGEEVPGEAVPEHCGAGRVLLIPPPDRDAGEDLVPEPTRQGQAPAGSGNRKDQDGGPGPRSAGCPVGHGRVLPPQPDAFGISGGPVGVRARSPPGARSPSTPHPEP